MWLAYVWPLKLFFTFLPSFVDWRIYGQQSNYVPNVRTLRADIYDGLAKTRSFHYCVLLHVSNVIIWLGKTTSMHTSRVTLFKSLAEKMCSKVKRMRHSNFDMPHFQRKDLEPCANSSTINVNSTTNFNRDCLLPLWATLSGVMSRYNALPRN